MPGRTSHSFRGLDLANQLPFKRSRLCYLTLIESLRYRGNKIRMKASVYIATSLDGLIARDDGALDWLDEANTTVSEGEDCGFQTFMDSVDTLIMGRKTYEKVLSLGQWPYGETPVVVLSRKSIFFSVQPAGYCHPFFGIATRPSCTTLE